MITDKIYYHPHIRFPCFIIKLQKRHLGPIAYKNFMAEPNTKVGRSLSVKINSRSSLPDERIEEEGKPYKSKKGAQCKWFRLILLLDQVLDKMGVGKKERKKRAVSPRTRSQSCKAPDVDGDSPEEQDNFSETSPEDDIVHLNDPLDTVFPPTTKARSPSMSPQLGKSERNLTHSREPEKPRTVFPPRPHGVHITQQQQQQLQQQQVQQQQAQVQLTQLSTNPFEDLALLAEKLQTKAKVVQESLEVQKRTV